MYSSIISGAILGIDVIMVNVEVDLSYGMPIFDMGGALSTEVKEAKDRVRVAIKNTGIAMKPMRIAVNISPADIKKQGTGFDLPIAVGILTALGTINSSNVEKVMVIGELGLNGGINAVNGILPYLCEAVKHGINRCIVPKGNEAEALLVDGMEVYAAASLADVIEFLNNERIYCRADFKTRNTGNKAAATMDFEDIRGQYSAKRAAMLAAAGRHNLMLVGSPGCGKTMIAQRMHTIMPPMSFEEQLEVSKIYSIAGLLPPSSFVYNRPFRSPHHTITAKALLGGGSRPGPGEITLAHHGVLFLDELTQFKMHTLENLRQPIEDKRITISRVSGSYTFPTDFMLAAAMNPCKCGYFPDRTRCRCTEADLNNYIGKISHPMWDRFDMAVKVDDVSANDIIDEPSNNNLDSATMYAQVEQAVEIQKKRFGKAMLYNGIMTADDIKKYCELGPQETDLMKEIYECKHLTARGYHKLLKVSRTIADFAGSDRIRAEHISEAVSFRVDSVREVAYEQ